MSQQPQKAIFTLPALQLIDQDPVKASFIDTLVLMHRYSQCDAEATYEREARYYKRLLSETPYLQEATGLSLVSTFFEVAITGLSLQPGQKSDCYIEARSSKQKQKQKREDKVVEVEAWVRVARLVITAYGELNLRIKAGQIIRMNNPIVIYEGDKFQPRTNARGELTVDYVPAIPRISNKIIGAWVSIILPHNGIDFKWLLEDDIERLKNYSIPRATKINPNPEANALYQSNEGQIDPGFLEAKTIKHAMRSYTKLKVSDNIAFEGDSDDDKPQSFVPPQKEQETVKVEQQTQQTQEEEEVF